MTWDTKEVGGMGKKTTCRDGGGLIRKVTYAIATSIELAQEKITHG